MSSRLKALLGYCVILLGAGWLFYITLPSPEMMAAVEQNRLTTIVVSKEKRMEVVILHPRGKDENARSRESAVPLLWSLEQMGFQMVDASVYTGVIDGVRPRDMGKCSVQTLQNGVKVDCGRLDYGVCLRDKLVRNHIQALVVIESFMTCMKTPPSKAPPASSTLKSTKGVAV